MTQATERMLYLIIIINLNLNGDNSDLDSIVFVRLMSWHNRFKQCKKDKQIINACGMASNKIVQLVYQKIKKENRNIFDRYKIIQ